MWSAVRQAAYGLLLLALAATAVGHAGPLTCRRPLIVPLAATGRSVVLDDGLIRGIYPDLLRTLASAQSCTFVLTAVPRARLEMMFEVGQADVLIPATRTPARDARGSFVPLLRNRATLIATSARWSALRSTQDLLAQPGMTLAVVRGFDYGPAYQTLLHALEAQGRLRQEADPRSVARLLQSGAADATIMAPVILYGELQDGAQGGALAAQLHFQPLQDLPWGESGLYLSRSTLTTQDEAALRALLRPAPAAVWRSFAGSYPAAVLRAGIRPL